MFGSTVLDVAVGLALVYLLFALLCSSIREGIGRLLEEREAGLVAGLYRFLGEYPPPTLTDLNFRRQAAKIASKAQAVVASLNAAANDKRAAARRGDPSGKDGGAHAEEGVAAPTTVADVVVRLLGHGLLRGMAKQGKAPSHLPAQSFALALLDSIAPTGKPPRSVAAARTLVEDLPEGALKQVLAPLVESAGDDMVRLQNAIEKRFDDTMTSASAWYKRRTQVWVGVFAFVVAAGANVDSIAIASTLYRDPIVRACVVAKATHQAPPPQDSSGPKDTYSASASELKAVGIPIGWDLNPSSPRVQITAWDVALKIFGILLTALALLLGAPFWFDVLSKLTSLRATVSRMGTATPSVGEDSATKVPPAT